MTLKTALQMMSLEEPESWSGGFYTGRSGRHVVHLDRELETENINFLIQLKGNYFLIHFEKLIRIQIKKLNQVLNNISPDLFQMIGAGVQLLDEHEEFRR
jgi:hypothetical protein